MVPEPRRSGLHGQPVHKPGAFVVRGLILLACGWMCGQVLAPARAAEPAGVSPQPAVPVLSTPARHAGHLDMSPSLQAMQADDSQNPAMLWVAGGRERWALECTGCHGAEAATRMRGVAARYPAWDATLGRVLTLNQRIRHCRTRAPGASGAAAPAASGEGAAPAVAPSASVAAVDRGPADAVSQPRPALRDNTPDSENVLSLQALVALQSRGMAIQPAQDDATAALARQGERLFQRRLGALELSCADCHEQRAPARLRGGGARHAVCARFHRDAGAGSLADAPRRRPDDGRAGPAALSFTIRRHGGRTACGAQLSKESSTALSMGTSTAHPLWTNNLHTRLSTACALPDRGF
ncbi:MAG: sulfur oxidation c-type cytochrome SoxA [Pseudomonadota bacterium]